MSDMRLELERSGGFGALSMPVMMLDTADVASQYAEELAELVDAAERAPLRQRRRAPSPTP